MLPDDVKDLLGKAHNAYICGEFATAIKFFSEVARKAPKLPDAYHTMGLIYEESGNSLRALQLYFIAAIHSKKNPDSWRKVATLAYELKQYRQALHAIRKVIFYDHSYVAYTQKAYIFLELGNTTGALNTINRLMKSYPNETDFLLEFGDHCIDRGYVYRGTQCYLQYIFLHSGFKDLPREIIFDLKMQRYSHFIPYEDINLDKVFYAARRVIDILLYQNNPKSLKYAFLVTQACLDMLKGINSMRMVDKPPAVAPLDMALLFALSQLHVSDDVTLVVQVLSTTRSLLQAFDAQLFSAIQSPPIQRSQNSLTGDKENAEADMPQNDVITNAMREKLGDVDVLDVVVTQRLRISEVLCEHGMVAEAHKFLVDTTCACQFLIDNVLSIPRRAELYHRASIVYEICQDYREALRVSLCSVRSEPNDPRTLHRFAELCRRYDSGKDFVPHAFQMMGVHFTALSLTFELLCASTVQEISRSPSTGTDNAMQKAGTLAASTSKKSTFSEISVADENGDNLSVTDDLRSGVSDAEYAALVASGLGATDGGAGEGVGCSSSSEDDDPEDDEADGGEMTGMDRPELLRQLLGNNGATGNSHLHSRGDSVPCFKALYYSYYQGKSASFLEIISPVEELLTATYWASYLREELNKKNISEQQGDGMVSSYQNEYLSVSVPIMHAWYGSAVSSISGPRRGVNHAYGYVIHMSILASMASEIPSRSFVFPSAGTDIFPYRPSWLDSNYHALYNFITSLCDYARIRFGSIENVLGRDTLLALAQGAGATLMDADLIKEASTLRENCTFIISTAKRNTNSIPKHKEESSAIDHTGGESSKEGAGTANEEEVILAEKMNRKYFSEQEVDERDLSWTWRLRSTAMSHSLATSAAFRIDTATVTALQSVAGTSDSNSKKKQNRNGNWRLRWFENVAKDMSPAVWLAAKAFTQNPHDISLANILTRTVLSNRTFRMGTTCALEFLPLTHFYSAVPSSLPAIVMAGHDLFRKKRYARALDRYLTAYRQDPSQPLVALCIVLQLLVLSKNPNIGARHDVLLKMYSFVMKYSQLRCNDSNRNGGNRKRSREELEQGLDEGASDEIEYVTSAALRQEVLYNMGRVMDDLRLYHLAVDLYSRALQLAEENPVLLSADHALHLTRESAHNLVLIYRRSGSYELALDIMLKYLYFD